MWFSTALDRRGFMVGVVCRLLFMIVLHWLGPALLVAGWVGLACSFLVSFRAFRVGASDDDPWWISGARNYETMIAANATMVGAVLGSMFMAVWVVGPMAVIEPLTAFRVGLVLMTVVGIEAFRTTESRFVRPPVADLEGWREPRLSVHLLNLQLYSLAGGLVLVPAQLDTAGLLQLLAWGSLVVLVSLRWTAVGRAVRVVRSGPAGELTGDT